MRITLYMLRAGNKLQQNVLRESRTFKEISIVDSGDESITWRLFYKPTRSKPAPWTENIRSIVSNPSALNTIRTQSSSAVLLAQFRDRIFAVTFGGGHFALESGVIEPGFGLRVTANVVARNSVTSADTKGFNQASRSQKTILPAANEFYALGIRPTEDWVRQLSGRVPNKEFASTAAGADSLRLNIKHFYMRNLPHKLQQISAYYDQNDYKENFGFLDNFIRIDRSDPVVAILDKEVESLLLANDDRLTFAAPDPFEQLNIDHCRIQYRRHADTDELDVSDVYAILDKLAVKDTRCTEYKSMPVARTAKTSHRFTTYTSIYKLNLTTTDSVTR